MSLVAEVQSLLLHNERMVKNSLVNGQDVLAEEPYKEQLYPSEEKDAYNERRDTRPEPVPVNQLQDQVNDGHDKTGRADRHPAERRDAERHFGISGNPGHRHIIEAVIVVLALARPALRAVIGNGLIVITELRYHAAEVGHRIMDIPHDVDKVLVIEAKAREVFNVPDIRDFPKELIITLPEKSDQESNNSSGGSRSGTPPLSCS